MYVDKTKKREISSYKGYEERSMRYVSIMLELGLE